MTVKCVNCDKPARWPADFKRRGFDAPLFCSKSCAANRQVEACMDHRVCPIHRIWYDASEEQDGKCPDCWRSDYLADKPC
jgi:hypothetical protein